MKITHNSFNEFILFILRPNVDTFYYPHARKYLCAVEIYLLLIGGLFTERYT